MFSTIQLSLLLVPVLIVTGAVLPLNNTGTGKTQIDQGMPSSGLPAILPNDTGKDNVLKTTKVDDNTEMLTASKRKETAVAAESETNVGKDSSGVNVKASSTTKNKLTPEKVAVDTTKPQASSPDPVDKKPINLLAISSSTASSIADSSGEVPPPVNKLPVPQNIDTEDNPPSPSQSTTKENGAKQPSTSNKKDNNAPLDKNSEDILGPDQLQVPGENDDYPVSPNLDGSEEMIPYAAGNDENIAKSKPDAKNTNSQNINQEQDTPNRKETFKYHSKLEKYEETEDGGYFNYFVFITTFLVLLLLAYHNKRRLVAYIVEGRKPRASRSRRRSSSASGTSYRRLENNFE